LEEKLPVLSRELGYTFHKPILLQRALTHRSRGGDNNERLEFLGDSVLGFTVSGYLYQHYPDLTEGELTRLRARLVRKETLAELARSLNLGNYLLLGPGELRTGGFDRASILADALEAIIGAIYVDGGFDAARNFVVRLFGEKLVAFESGIVEKDPKTRLQEYLQKHGLETPRYEVLKVHGEPHKQTFRVECHIPGLATPVEGSGRSRRIAEQEAAARALDLLSAES
jgi:ribonuclease-3